MKSILLPSLAGLALLGLAACGGGSSSSGGSSAPVATGTLSYVNPTYQGEPFQFALVKDSASTSTNLVLDVVGPTGTGYSLPSVGITFGFSADPTKVTWGGTSPNAITNGDVFTQGTGSTIVNGFVSTGGYLQGIVAYRGLSTEVSDVGTGIIAKVTLTPVAGATAGTVTLTDTQLGNFMDQQGPPALPITFAVGTLTLN